MWSSDTVFSTLWITDPGQACSQLHGKSPILLLGSKYRMRITALELVPIKTSQQWLPLYFCYCRFTLGQQYQPTMGISHLGGFSLLQTNHSVQSYRTNSKTCLILVTHVKCGLCILMIKHTLFIYDCVYTVYCMCLLVDVRLCNQFVTRTETNGYCPWHNSV